MSTLIIRKRSLKTWVHTDSVLGDFIISKFYFNADNVSFQIVEQGQSRRVIYNINDITLYNTVDGGGAETFTTITQLSLRLEQLNYPAFQTDGQITSIANLLEGGDGVDITGDGTEASPYIINLTSGDALFLGSYNTLVALQTAHPTALDGSYAFVSQTGADIVYFFSTEENNWWTISGGVTSVNTKTGDVVLNQDEILDGTTYKQYSLTEKNKLAGVEDGAQVNVNADWNATSGDAFIENKPSITTPTLQEVLIEDNKAENISIFSYDNVADPSNVTRIDYDGILINDFVDGSINEAISINKRGLQFIKNVEGIGFRGINVNYEELTNNDFKTINFPNASGRIALTSDITTPNLQEVLLEGNRPVKNIKFDYTFEDTDRGKYLLITDAAELTLNPGALAANSELLIKKSGEGTFVVKLIAGTGVIIYFNDTEITDGNSLTIEQDDLFILKQDGNFDKWYLSIISSSQTSATPRLSTVLTESNETDGNDIAISDGDKIVLDNGANLKKGTTDAGLGGTKGIALRCAVDYELKWEAGRLYVMGGDGFTIREVSHNFTTIPTENDDDSKGFVVGSRWILDNGEVYLCGDATTGFAVWEIVNTGTTPTLQDVTSLGNETTNDIIVGVPGDSSTISPSSIGVQSGLDSSYMLPGGIYAQFFNTAGDGQNEYVGITYQQIYKNFWDGAAYVLNYFNFPIIGNGASATLALTSDIPTLVEGSGIDIDYTDPLNPIISATGGGGGGVPYTGATQDLDLGEFGLRAGQVTLDNTPTGTANVGTTRWNDTLGSSETLLKGGSVILKNGVDLVARVVNKVSPNTTLTKANYQVVRISGAQGQRLAVDLARANNDLNSADTLGVVTETINANQEGFILTVGQLEGINTTGSLQGETWADGNVLYLSPTTAGAITNIKPNGSNGHIVIIGYVEHAHNTQGKIYVKIMNGWELDELHNVFIDTPLNNQGLTYESSTGLWKNKTIIEDSITNGVTDKAPSQNAVFDALALKQAVLSYSPYKNVQTSQTVHTGTTLETPIFTATIPAGTFNSQDIIKVLFGINKTTSLAAYTLRLRLSTTNNPLGGTLIALYTGGTGTQSVIMTRNFNLNGGNLYGVSFPTTILTDQVATNVLSSTALNPSNQFFIHANISLANAGDSINISMLSIHN
jgi:nitrogen fixation protein